MDMAGQHGPRRYAGLLIVIPTLCVACSISPPHPNALQTRHSASGTQAAPQVNAGVPLLASAADEQADVPTDQRVVIHNAGYRIVVNDVSRAMAAAERLAADFGGYVQQITGDRIILRIPAHRFDEATGVVRDLGEVVAREREVIDVTDQYIDLQARLRNARAVHERLTKLLDEAKSVDDALAVERELKRLGEEIERYEAQLAALENRVAYATVAITFERVAHQVVVWRDIISLPFPWLQELEPLDLFRKR